MCYDEPELVILPTTFCWRGDLNFRAELIYEVNLDDDGYCEVKMTLTTMGCPLADVITEQIHQAVSEVDEVEVKLVWYLAWTTDRMSHYARISLGIK
nr:metal-sulfur cluster assembly factor [Vagococcus sp. DIV0080]